MTYRDDLTALEQREAELARELESAGKEAEDLRRRHAQVKEELESVRASLKNKKRALPLLDSIKIASPCNASWDEMVGDDRIRFCNHCEKNVYNLSAMQRDEAEAMLRDRSGGMCVRIFQRADGTVLTEDCPVGVKKKRVRRLAFAAVGGGLMAAASALGLQGAKMGESQHAMGAIESKEMIDTVPVPKHRVLQGDIGEPEPRWVAGGISPPPASSPPPPPPPPTHVRMGKPVLR